MDEKELQRLLGVMLDALEFGSPPSKKDWDTACLLSGRYCPPWIILDDETIEEQ